MLTAILILAIIAVILLFALLLLLVRRGNDREALAMLHHQLDETEDDLQAAISRLRQELSQTVQTTVASLGTLIGENQKHAGEQTESRLKTFETTNEQKLEAIRLTIERRLTLIQTDSNHRLEEMRQVVDEKLQKTIESKMTQSFQLVNERLEQVYKGLGEMQTLASGVGDLKKVLSNVKTRGILGETQLGAILEEILSPEQYEVNTATKSGSTDRVEYAIRIPTEDGQRILLPVDSKFPGVLYANLQDAYESGSPELVKAAALALDAEIKKEAKDIHTKYVDPPNTTDFAILFLPFEGLYAEVVNRGMVEELQRAYRVNIAGPSTMAALLNSLQMSFRTFAIQKRSGEVWQVLGAVKTEFEKFEKTLKATQQRLRQADDELNELIGRRTRVIVRKLSSVERLEEAPASELLDAAASAAVLSAASDDIGEDEP